MAQDRIDAHAEATGLFAEPRTGVPLDDCHFYHCMDVPGVGAVDGDWDLRGGVDEYLGGVDFAAQRVLEVGPASGFLTFEMERRGASVTCIELDPAIEWDHLPDVLPDAGFRAERQRILERMRNGFWFAHEHFGSRARVHYGYAGNLPQELGRFDVAVMASVLLHLRDPLRVVEACTSMADTVVIVDIHCPELDGTATMRFRRAREPETKDTWWDLSPDLLVHFLSTCGFAETTVTYGTQRHVAGGSSYEMPLFTLVGRRTS
jgi:SAM-dependent methyltransferase